MSAKTFKTAPTPTRAPSDEQILAFVKAGRPEAFPAQPEAKKPAPTAKEPTARLSLDIPESLHARFKAACARKRLKMTAELLAFIEQRTTELEG